jgi:competence protein ComGF
MEEYCSSQEKTNSFQNQIRKKNKENQNVLLYKVSKCQVNENENLIRIKLETLRL